MEERDLRCRYLRLAAFYALVHGPRKASKRLADAAANRAVAALEAAGVPVPLRMQEGRRDPYTRVAMLEDYVEEILQREGISAYPRTRAEAFDLEAEIAELGGQVS